MYMTFTGDKPTALDVTINRQEVIGGNTPGPDFPEGDGTDFSWYDDLVHIPFTKPYDPAKVTHLLDYVGYSLVVGDSCSDVGADLFKQEATKKFVRFGGVAHIPEEDVHVTVTNSLPVANKYPDGRADNADLANRVGLKKPIPDKLQIDVQTTCNAYALESDGSYFPQPPEAPAPGTDEQAQASGAPK
jgi:hypothetical protein